ncbi:hydroxyethylthiazole kinase [Neorhizobium lilium]|uniref:Hydroxyethylthiazole kinase n=1 Tax=Neorhizobium lilium TaxID=2503024 RepID=A0A3S3T487_9HYPH|nr:hydroxyethylthiazole kinase [Neorhizobium lilium]RWX81714.1 hydroxyethylthiazole kinase [Neorhizobium lilium]
MNAQNDTPGQLLEAMRQANPLVQCITNYVAMNIAANVMLAAGASPAMVSAVEEAGEFAGIAGALTVNIGTLSASWIAGMKAAAAAANGAGKPWVLDPVAHYATGFRRQVTAELLGLKPTIIRGNASEIMALAGHSPRGQGVDSGDPTYAAEGPAMALAQQQGCIVAVTGEVDFVTDGRRTVRILGGSPVMPRITALGCSLTCLVGAFAAIRPEAPMEATVAALALFAAAGEDAARTANGPGSFQPLFLDRLASLTGAELDAQMRISTL